jgi:serine/threonine protein kinase
LLDPATASSVFGYTLNYAPLEQIENKGTDPRSDLYSSGATLYQLMTAVVPPGSLSRAAAIVTGDGDPLVSASIVNPQVPPPIALILSRAMSLQAEQRPSSAVQMRRDFAETRWQPTTGHPVFGQVAVDSGSPAPGRWTAPPPSAPAVDAYEAPTRIMAPPNENVALDTVPIVHQPKRASASAPPVRRPRWTRVTVGSTIVLLIPIMVLWIRLSEHSVPPVPITTAATERQIPQPPPPPFAPPRIPLPASPPQGTPQTTGRFAAEQVKLDNVEWPGDGTVKLTWSPVDGAISYKLEGSGENPSHIWTLANSKETTYTVRLSGETTRVRLTAICRDGRRLLSRWFPIN